MPKTILLDPGHGGYDSGAVDTNLGSVEKEMNLEIALSLKSILEAYQIPVVMTRETDVCPAGDAIADVNQDLKARVTIADDHHADLFLSIHNNAGGGTGSEIYVYHDGGNVATLARDIVEGVGSLMGLHGEPVKDGSGLYVIRNSSMSAMLLEVGFVDTAADVEKVKSHVQEIAQLIAKPLIAWAGGIVPAPVVEAPAATHVEEPTATHSEDRGNYAPYIGFVLEHEIMHELSPGVFGVGTPVTREQLAVVITRIHELVTTGKVTK